MKIINNFLDMMGFSNFQDLIGKSVSFDPKHLSLLTISIGSIGGIIEMWTGISMYFWLFLVAGTLFDISFGVYANVIVLKSEFESKRFFRGIFKSFVVLFIIVITNFLNLGVKHSDIHPEFLKTTFEYMAASLHYSFVMLISLYLLTGIAENGAKIQIPVFISLSKILKMKINTVEELNKSK